MKKCNRLIIFFWIFLGCGHNTDSKISTDIPLSKQEAIKLKKLILNVYNWHEIDTLNSDFQPIADNKDSVFIGIDFKKHEIRCKELRSTGMFAEEFIGNYDRIAKMVDKKLKTKEYEWLVGDLPPFGNDANPWCNCQDTPDDNPWGRILINILSYDGRNAILTWTWGGLETQKNFKYTIKVSKANNQWKVSYMEGFDYNLFSKRNY